MTRRVTSLTDLVYVGLPVQEAVILARVPSRHVTAAGADVERAVGAVRQTRHLNLAALPATRSTTVCNAVRPVCFITVTVNQAKLAAHGTSFLISYPLARLVEQ